jgi:hypothetical protein
MPRGYAVMRCSALRHQLSDELRDTHPDHRSEDLLDVPQGRPCGRPPAAAVLGRSTTATGSVYRSHRPDAPRT